jgi:hypothetical protein
MSLKEDFVELLKGSNDYYDQFRKYIDYADGGEDPINIAGFTVQAVDQYGGSDLGSEYWVVFSISRENELRDFDEKEFFKLDGWYASYNGHEFDDFLDFNEVKQVEKVIKVWE